nr:hypothetical protein [Kofleriaceae bacterium]
MSSLVVLGTCGAVGGFYAARAASPHAASTAAPLFYSGTLSQNGVPAANNPAQKLSVTVFGSPTGTDMLCAGSTDTVAVVAGQFSMQMSAACHDALVGATAAYIEIAVDGTKITPRQQVGATPFSFTAETVKTPPQPIILGTTKVQFNGDGVPENDPTKPGGYGGLQARCQTDFGSAAFVCSASDAAKSIAAGQFGNVVEMNTRGWVVGSTVGADLDCDGFTQADPNKSGMVFDYAVIGPPTTVVIPQTNTCDDGDAPFALCCGYP